MPVENLSQTKINILLAAHVYDTHDDELCLVSRYAQDAIAHDIRSRVYPKDNAGVVVVVPRPGGVSTMKGFLFRFCRIAQLA